MKKTERVRYEMLLRVRDFGAAHKDLFPESTTDGQTFARVAKATAEIEAHTLAKSLAAKSGRKSKAAAREAVIVVMQELVRTARGLAVTAPGLEHALEMPQQTSDIAILDAARSFVRQAEPIKDELVALRLPPTRIEELRRAAEVFDEAIDGRRAGRTDLAAARGGITDALADGLSAVRLLDVIVPNVVKDDPVLTAAWKRVRKVIEGRSRTTDVVYAEEGDPLRKAS